MIEGSLVRMDRLLCATCGNLRVSAFLDANVKPEATHNRKIRFVTPVLDMGAFRHEMNIAILLLSFGVSSLMQLLLHRELPEMPSSLQLKSNAIQLGRLYSHSPWF